MNLAKLSDQDLAKMAKDIDFENKRRGNLKAAASAILAILEKYELSVSDLSELQFDQPFTKQTKKKTIVNRGRKKKPKISIAKTVDKRAKVASKFKNPKGDEQWSGRGRTPKWVADILSEKRMSIAQFKNDKRYMIMSK